MYYLIGYRKAVVYDNIQKAFPKKSHQEVIKTSKVFFRHLCDLIFESVKNFSITQRELDQRIKYTNTECSKSHGDQGMNIIGTAGHYGSWEMASVQIGSIKYHQHYGIIKPLANKFFHEKVMNSRTKFNTGIVPMKETKFFFQKEHPRPVCLTFIADQWPSNPAKCHWTSFLGRDTPFYFGAEKYAREYNLPVYYFDITRTKRGHYSIEMSLICEDPSKLSYGGELIDIYAKKLEQSILRNPAYYLWSHRRWKKTKEEVFGEPKLKDA